MKAIHFSTVHDRADTRIRRKECVTLAENLDSVIGLYVQDGAGDIEADGVRVMDVGQPLRNRFVRLTVGPWRIWRAIRAARPLVAHFHDPELIPVGLALKLSGIKVIYDVHEDVPRQIVTKHWIPVWLRRPVAWGATAAEWLAACVLDGIVTATPKIAERFPVAKTVVVQNFPLLDELVALTPIPYAERPSAFAYIGGVTAIRGWREMLRALAQLPETSGVILEVAGSFTPAALYTEAKGHPAWLRTRFHGWADRPAVANILGSCRAGLVIFQPSPNHVDAQPNKMFEYMAAGLPVIASDFPLWRQIIDGAGCGLLVDPLDPKAIAEAMQWVLDHPAEAEAMGQRGRQAVLNKYNWQSEAQKLVALYERLLIPGTTPNDF